MRSACDSHRSKRTLRSSQNGVILRWNWEASKFNFADLGVYAPLSNKPTFVRSYQKGLGLTKTSSGWKKTTGRSYCWWWELQDFLKNLPDKHHPITIWTWGAPRCWWCFPVASCSEEATGWPVNTAPGDEPKAVQIELQKSNMAWRQRCVALGKARLSTFIHRPIPAVPGQQSVLEVAPEI